MTLLYFGADRPWHQFTKRAFRRRNEYLLQAFTQCPEIERVLVISYLIRSAFFRRLRRSRGQRSEGNGKVADIYVSLLIPERRWLPLIPALNNFLMRLQIWWQAGSLTGEKLICWCYWPEAFHLASRIGLPGRLAFDVDHNLLCDPNETAGEPAELERSLRRSARKADLVVAGSRSMLDWFRRNGFKNTLYLRNGVDLSRFSNDRSRRQNGAPRIGYVGILSRWVDYGLLEQLAKLRPNWRFIVAGSPHGVDLSPTLANMTNVEVIGAIAADELPSFLQSLDAAVGLYRVEPGGDVDSMKLFEYLAAGVPVVTTRFHEFLDTDFNGLLEFGDDAPEFVRAIEGVLKRDSKSSSEWRIRCREFVERNTWATRAAEVVKVLHTLDSTSPAALDNVA